MFVLGLLLNRPRGEVHTGAEAAVSQLAHRFVQEGLDVRRNSGLGPVEVGESNASVCCSEDPRSGLQGTLHGLLNRLVHRLFDDLREGRRRRPRVWLVADLYLRRSG